MSAAPGEPARRMKWARVPSPTPRRRGGFAFPRRVAVTVVLSAVVVGLVVVVGLRLADRIEGRPDRKWKLGYPGSSKWTLNSSSQCWNTEHRFWLVKLGDETFLALC